MNTITKENKQLALESMRWRLTENDTCNYSQGYDVDTLYKMIKEGIKGYDNMTDEEVSRIHNDVFGWVELSDGSPMRLSDDN